MKDVLETLRSRGLVQGVINEEALLTSTAQGVVAYAGFDATAKSLHVGHLVVFRVLQELRDAGVPVIGLVGEGTARVGDPSFRTTERQMLDRSAVEMNAVPVRKTIQSLISGPKTRIMSNSDWLSDLNVLDFLTETGKHFTMSRMLSFESVADRLGTGLTFLEFAYMLLQARDFLELHDRFGCNMQVGGSDQWANILCGTDLIRKVRTQTAFGITAPLLTHSDGRKMGKSGGGAVWLDPDLTSDFEFWQFWRNTPDTDVSLFLRIFTNIPLDECARLGALGGAEVNVAKQTLADAVTRMVRGSDAADAASRAATATHEDGEALSGLPKLSITQGPVILRALQAFSTIKSAKAARRAMDEGVHVNESRISDPMHPLCVGDVVRFGKRKLLITETA